MDKRFKVKHLMKSAFTMSRGCAFLLLEGTLFSEAIFFFYFTMFKDQLISINKNLYILCADCLR